MLLSRFSSCLLRYKPSLHARAVPFQCLELADSHRTCKLHRSGSRPETVRLGDTQCFFGARDGSGRRYHSLFEASLAF